MRECPFCSFSESTILPYNKSEFEPTLMPDRNTEAKYRVVCRVCSAEGPPATTSDMAVKKWDGLLAKIDKEKLFKAALNENSMPNFGYELQQYEKAIWHAIEEVVGTIYEDDELAIEELTNFISSNIVNITDPSDLWDIVSTAEFADGQISENDVEIFSETIFKYLKMGDLLNEDMGGVSAPMATLTNTPGVGNAQPASSAAMTGAQQTSDSTTGSGDKWTSDSSMATQDNIVKEAYIDQKFSAGANHRSLELDDKISYIVKFINKTSGTTALTPIDVANRFSSGEIEDFYEKITSGDGHMMESNLNPYDKIGAMMAKKMGVKQPFKKKNYKTNTIKQGIIDETDNPNIPFKIETLDNYDKASKHVPKHPLQTKKVNEGDESESPSDQSDLKDVKSKEKLKKLGIPFVYKPGPSGKKRVYIKGDINDAVKKLEELKWEEQDVVNNPNKTVKIFRNGKDELTIYTDGKDLPRITLKTINESIIATKVVSNSLEPYIK